MKRKLLNGISGFRKLKIEEIDIETINNLEDVTCFWEGTYFSAHSKEDLICDNSETLSELSQQYRDKFFKGEPFQVKITRELYLKFDGNNYE